MSNYMTFIGETLKEAMNNMYDKAIELDIVDQIHIVKKSVEQKKGFLGFGRKKYHKVTVIVSESSRIRKIKKRKDLFSNTPQLFSPNDVVHGNSISNTKITLESKPIKSKDHSREDTLLATENMELRDELNTLKSSVDEIKTELRDELREQLLDIKRSFIQGQVNQEIDKEKEVYKEIDISQKNIRWIENYLNYKEFSKYAVDDISKYLREQKSDILMDKTRIFAKVREFLRKNILTEDVFLEEYNFGNTVLFVGPTGVGKTVTIIKMAAHVAAMREKSMRFISIDKYKVGANSQLESYSEILKSKFYAATSEESFLKVVSRDERDFTFIDSAGRSPKDTVQVNEIVKWLKLLDKKIDIHLVLSATTKARDLEYITEQYEILDYQHIIATKLDETLSYGAILSMLYKTQRPLSFITNGQNVPQDFEIANIDKMIAETIN